MEETLDVAKRPCQLGPGGGPGWRHYALLAFIILLGAGLRLLWLDHPALWGDEAATWGRTCGTFAELLERNRGDGFVPLHYELYWVLREWWGVMTPWRMRIVPAVAGILMIPAMYFLARELLRPGTALVTALFVATSAYFLNYSRDAKMYMQTWLMAVLHLWFLLRWLKKGGAGAWWGWVATGVAAVGLHATAWFVVGIGALMWASSGRPGWRWAAYPLGIAIMLVGPLVYYQNYNTWMERSGGIAPGTELAQDGGSWFKSGINWIEVQTRRKSDPELLRDVASAYLFGYSRAEEEVISGAVPIPDWARHCAWGALGGCLIVLSMGLVRWPARKVEASAERLGAREGCACCGGAWSGWRVLLWMGAWIVAPAYGFFYCRSVRQPASPVDWVREAWGILGWGWVLAGAITAGLCLLAGRWRAMKWVVAGLLGAAVSGLVLGAIVRNGAEWYVVMGEWIGRGWVLGGVVALMAAVSWSGGDEAVQVRWRRWLVAGVIVAGVLAACEGAWLGWAHLRKVAEAAGKNWASMWMPRYLAVAAPAVLMIMAWAIGRLPGRAVRVMAATAFVAVNLAQFGAKLWLDPEPRMDLLAGDLAGGERDRGYVVFVRDRMSATAGSPGRANANDAVARYYLAQMLGGTYHPWDIGRGPTDIMLREGVHWMSSLKTMVGQIKARPEAYRLVLWEKLSLPRTQPAEAVAEALKPEWILVSRWEQKVRRHWNWQDIDTYRRMEFVRASPTTRAASEQGIVSFP